MDPMQPNADIVRLLDFDADPQCEVRLAGRCYTIRQQRRAVMEKILQAIYPEREDEAADDKAPSTWREVALHGIERWGKHFEVFALMLGAEDADLAETTKHLEEHLSWPRARKIFEAWYEINDVFGFLQRDGNALVPERLLEELARERELTTLRDEILATKADDAAESSPSA